MTKTPEDVLRELYPWLTAWQKEKVDEVINVAEPAPPAPIAAQTEKRVLIVDDGVMGDSLRKSIAKELRKTQPAEQVDAARLDTAKKFFKQWWINGNPSSDTAIHAKVLIAAASLKQETPLDYWRCFHCDFATTNRAEAEAHFGDRDDAEEFKPICKWWQSMSEDERIGALQDTLQQLNEAQNDFLKLKQETQPPSREPRVFRLGLGEVILEVGDYGDHRALFIEPATIAGTVGTAADVPKNSLQEGSVILVIHDPAGLKVLTDKISILASSSPLETPAPLILRCYRCKATLMAKQIAPNEYEIFNLCETCKTTPAPADTGAPCQSGPCSAMAPAGKKFCESCSTGDTPQPQEGHKHEGFPLHINRHGAGFWDKNCAECCATLHEKVRIANPAALGKTPDADKVLSVALDGLGKMHDSLEDGSCLPESLCDACELQREILEAYAAPRLATPDAREEKEK